MRVRGRRLPPEPVQTQRINDQIDVPEVRLIDQDGENVGVVPLEEALRRAQEAALDLVEVAPNGKPPVCRIADNSKIQYELRRKQREAKRQQKAHEIKEIKMKPRIGPHDYDIKMKHAKELLEQGHRVRLTVEIRGRRRVNQEVVEDLYNRMLEDIRPVADVDFNTRSIGRSRSVIANPKETQEKS